MMHRKKNVKYSGEKKTGSDVPWGEKKNATLFPNRDSAARTPTQTREKTDSMA